MRVTFWELEHPLVFLSWVVIVLCATALTLGTGVSARPR